MPDVSETFLPVLAEVTDVLNAGSGAQVNGGTPARDRPGRGVRDEKLQRICELLAERFPKFDWVGFYIVEPGTRELVLGPFTGESTEHVRIPFGKGICGQAADREETFLISDVAGESNYLACSPFVKSEIVVPVFREGRVVAEIDIDSHTRDAFSSEDRRFLEEVAGRVSVVF